MCVAARLEPLELEENEIALENEIQLAAQDNNRPLTNAEALRRGGGQSTLNTQLVQGVKKIHAKGLGRSDPSAATCSGASPAASELEKNWNTTVDGNKVIFSYLSKDGEEGYPGDLITNVIYELTDDDQFHVNFLSTTTKKTVVNLTNHSYFNLAGHDGGAQGLFDHEVTVFADKITETNQESIPTGRFTNVGGTPFDLRIPRRLGDIISKNPKLFDNNFCITTFGKTDLRFISRVTHPPSGRYLEVYTNQPGVQLYTSYNLPAPGDAALIGKNGVGYRRDGAFCLESQNFPDAVHHKNFPSPILKPGDVYNHKFIYAFGSERGTEPTVVAS